METLQRKRKGTSSFYSIGFFLSDDPDGAREIKKKCRESAKIFRAKKVESCRHTGGEEKGISCACGAIVTAPPSCSLSTAVPAGRGLKRKVGCVDSATSVGRKNLEKDYLLGQEIGKGKFGSVRLCENKETGEEFACKTLLNNTEETVQREVEIMQHLSGHPGIVTIKALFQDEKSFHIVMELCSEGRLSEHMKRKGRYSEREAAILIKELVSIIKYCHEMGVVHRDIKPENILITSSGKLKLADFGLAVRITAGQKLAGLAGTPQYLAPEVLLGNYSEKVDIWASGILLHQLLVGVYPFPLGPREAVLEAVKNVKLDFDSELWESTSKLGRNLLGSMLARDVSERLGAEDVLSHPWISCYNESPLMAIPGKSSTRNNFESRNESDKFATTTSLTTSLERSKLVICENEGCGLVDSLASAISRMTIKELKRSRLCNSASPIKQKYSPNPKSNLCPAF